jgi:branched-chain amino acid transport system permease protein
MDQIILFALLGLGTGALIAGIGLGIVLTYRGSGVINLATGAISMVAGYLFFTLNTGGFFGVELDVWPAAIVGLLMTLVLGIACEYGVFRQLRNASPLAKLVASLGILLTAQASIVLIYGTAGRDAPGLLPKDIVEVAGAAIPADRFWLTGIVIVIAALLWALYKYTRFGLATRAASESEANALLAGLSPNRLALMNTILATLVAGFVGILASSLAQLDSTTLTLQVVPALGAVLFARFTSFAITCFAGLAIGVLQSLIYYFSTQTWFPTDQGAALPGVSALVTFVIIVIALWWRGSSLPTRGEIVEQGLPEAPRAERLFRPTAIAIVVGVIALIVLPYDYRNALVITMAGIVICLSFVVITGYVGQVSLAQVALAGAAGFTVSHFATDLGIDFPIGAIAGIAVATILGFITGVSALRVRGVSLAVVTLAAAVAIEQFGFASNTFGAGSTGSPVPEPILFGFDLGARNSFRGLDGSIPSPVLGFCILAVVVLTGLFVARLRISGLGQRMLAVRSNERAAAAAGVSVRNTKFAAFGISSFIAGVGGVLYAYTLGSVSADRFGILIALGFVAFAYVGGITMVSGAVFGGLIASEGVFSHFTQDVVGVSGTWTLLLGGVTLILNLVFFPDGVAGSQYQKKKAKAAEKARQQLAAAEASGGGSVAASAAGGAQR